MVGALGPIGRILLIVLPLLVWWTGPAHAGRRFALVMGNATYRNKPWAHTKGKQTVPLSGIVNDAVDLADLLRRLQFEVTGAELNLDRAAMADAIERFSGKLTRDDLALIFYAGHGGSHNGANYLIPVDMPANADQLTQQQWDQRAVDISALVERIRHRAGTTLLFLNNCLVTVPGLGGFAPSARRAQSLRIDNAPTYELLISYATAIGQFALPAPDGQPHTPYGEALLEYLPVRGLELREMMKRIRARVITETRSFQKPTYDDWLAQDLYLNDRPPPSRPALIRTIAGSITLAAGVGLAAYGAYATAINGRCEADPVPPQRECTLVYSTAPLGGALLGVGAVAAIGGVVLLAWPRYQETVRLALLPTGGGALVLGTF